MVDKKLNYQTITSERCLRSATYYYIWLSAVFFILLSAGLVIDLRMTFVASFFIIFYFFKQEGCKGKNIEYFRCSFSKLIPFTEHCKSGTDGAKL